METPKKDYSKFIQKITRKEKQDDGSYITVSHDYMMVDGRVKQFTDIHQELGKRFKFTRKFEKDESGTILCHAKVFSAIFGIAEATAGAYGRTTVDKSNPYENAETSAYGRCLGFFGLGLIGGGIASAEEVSDALERQEEPVAASSAVPAPVVPIPAAKPAKAPEEPITTPQLNFIHKLCDDLGLSEDGYRQYLDMKFSLKSSTELTKKQASEMITALQNYLLAEDN